ncbi:prepilin-type N-terminal cleavage/methylation domain-containing protein [Aquibacillus sediminis]|uniref:prepilin-type N-terminal cleavage/methylation domain-containing protein n=1 Tax=Aquibacillus sediminis TaxID=2574734 RepID=UPI00110940F3|nr:prepilin-type N-terminal cleavage/methylation domain-containing protein [Aquibacillus sediminis]
MLRKWTRMLKSQKGFTLVELLAVIVILGIIAAIAIPSIGGIINNTKDDAHDSNAIMMIEAARLAVASGDLSSGDTITLQELVNEGYLEQVPSNPEDGGYSGEVELDDDGNGNITYTVTLTDEDGSTPYVTAQTLEEIQAND